MDRANILRGPHLYITEEQVFTIQTHQLTKGGQDEECGVT
jgi:hypothetical protein